MKICIYGRLSAIDLGVQLGEWILREREGGKDLLFFVFSTFIASL